jgi:hypothetical protein
MYLTRERRTSMHTFHRPIIATILMLALQLVALTSWAFAQRTIDITGATSTVASGINDTGDIVGTYTLGGTIRGFLRSQAGGFTDITPVTGLVAVSGINDATNNVVVGTYTAGGTNHGFVNP